MLRIEIKSGVYKGKSFEFDKPDCFLLGRTSEAHISLPNDPYVSRYHFLMEIAPPQCKLSDLGSKNGTFVNNIRYGGRKKAEGHIIQAPNNAKETYIKDGDWIIVGDTTLAVSINSDIVQSNSTIIETDSSESNISGTMTLAFQEKESSPLLEHSAISNHSNGKEIILFERYQVIRELGRGGMGTVVLAKDLQNEKEVAIKTMLPHVAFHQESIRAFKREIDITRQLSHRNIVQLFDAGNFEDTFYVVLEYVEGMDFKDFLNQYPEHRNIHSLAPIMLDVLDGLNHAHHAEINTEIINGQNKSVMGVVHRDIKPQNILLKNEQDNWVPKVADFGLSKSFESAGLTDMTKPGQAAGTPLYWPKEQITHYRFLKPATDVFSVAAVFYQALTGKYIRHGFEKMFEQCEEQHRLPSISDYMFVIAFNPVVPIEDRTPDIPGLVAQAINKALAETEIPQDETQMHHILDELRFKDAGTFKEELTQALISSGINIPCKTPKS